MKKRLILLFATSSLVWLAALGCSNKNIDTAKVRAAFPSLSGEAKADLELALKSIDESNYVAADRPLKVLAIRVKMDKNQRVIWEDTMTKVQAKIAHAK